MKKIQLFLCAALLVGALSAFTTVKENAFQIAYGFDGIQWHQVNVEDINVTFRCDSGQEYCLFDAENGNPLPGQIENQQFVKLP